MSLLVDSARLKAEQSVANVNYGKWARTSQTNTATSLKKAPSNIGVSPLSEVTTGTTPTSDIRLPPILQLKVSTVHEELDSSRSVAERVPLVDRVTVSKNPRYGDHCSTKCHHVWLPSNTEEEEDVEEMEEYMKELLAAIAKKTEQLQRLQKLYNNVLSGNFKNLDAIDAEENDIFEGAEELITGYNKLESVARNLRKLANEEIRAAQREYDSLKEKFTAELRDCEAEVNQCAQKLTEARDHLKVLKSYKDKEHAVNQLRINKLTSELEQLRLDNSDNAKELQTKLSTRLQTQIRTVDTLKDEARIKSVVHLMQELPEPIQFMAQENNRLAEEIALQRAMLDPLRAEVRSLESEVKRLKSRRSSIKKCLFPELFKVQEKCTPDMDVVLNIPTQKKLPV